MIIGDENDVARWRRIARHNDREIFGFFGEYLFLSNFYLVETSYDRRVYPSAENAYQAAKFLDKDRGYFSTCSPSEAKVRARELKQTIGYCSFFLHDKRKVMAQVVQSKFRHNKELSRLLLATEGCLLVKANWWGDTYWGVHVDEQGNEIGENILGRILMGARAHCRFGTWTS